MHTHRLVFLGFILSLTPLAAYGLELTKTHGELTLRYTKAIPVEAVEMMATRAEAGFTVVRAFLAQAETYAGEPYDTPIEILIDPDQQPPYQRGSTIRLPEARILNIYNGVKDGRTDIGLIHEITHVLAASFNRQNRDRFYDDGLAVFLQHRFGPTPNYPDFGADLYVATARVASEHGGYLKLAETEATRRKTKSRTGRKLAYLQEGAFTQFLIESYGLDAYFRIYHGTDLEAVTGKTLEALEADWQAMLGAVEALL